MSKDFRLTDVLTPSVTSVAFCILGLGIALLVIVLPRLGGNAFLELIFGRDASLSLINSSKESYGPLLEKLLGNDLLGRAVVFGLWAFVGLCTFIIINTLGSIFGAIESQSRQIGYIHQSKESIVHQDIIALAYRLGIAVLWAVFISICLRYVLSYFAVTGFVALAGSGGIVNLLIFIAASAILYLALHMQVVFMRLFVGKIRLWNS